MSLAARKRIAAGQRASWARVRAEKVGNLLKPHALSGKPKRRILAAGRKRIAAAAKARWARVRAAKARKA
jgi:hypothetical protein